MLATENTQAVDSIEDLKELLAKAIVCLKLRDMLTQYGILPENKVTFGLAVEDKEPVSIELPEGKGDLSMEPTNKSLRDVLVDDFLLPADGFFDLIKKLLKFHGIEMPDPSELPANSEPIGRNFTMTLDVKDQLDQPQSSMSVSAFCEYCEYYYWC